MINQEDNCRIRIDYLVLFLKENPEKISDEINIGTFNKFIFKQQKKYLRHKTDIAQPRSSREPAWALAEDINR